MPASPGYSGTPLAKKLGIVAGSILLPIDAPAGYRNLLAPLPADVTFARSPSKQTDIAHLFVTSRARLTAQLTELRSTLRPDAALWVSWPKLSSKVPTEVSEDVIREVGLPMGWVDVKVCAVTDVWSGLKLVVRKELR
jgi:hypothetical protein